MQSTGVPVKPVWWSNIQQVEKNKAHNTERPFLPNGLWGREMVDVTTAALFGAPTGHPPGVMQGDNWKPRRESGLQLEGRPWHL